MIIRIMIYLLLTGTFAIFANAGEETKSKISVDGKSIADFGTYPAKDRKEAFFKIKNIGDSVLKIKKIRKTCGCAEAKMDKMELKPKEVGILKAVVLPDSIYGAYRKNIYIESNDPVQRFFTLTIAGKAMPILKVKPKNNIYAGTLPAGKEWTQEFLLEATEKGVELGKVAVEGNAIAKAEIIQKSETKFYLKVIITPDSKVAVFKCKIKIPILKPEGWKGIELQMMGKVLKPCPAAQ